MIGHSIEKECEGCKRRDTEIADLKRQLAISAVDVMEAVLEMMGYGLPQDEPIDIRLVRKSLDAYVQEKLAEQRESLRDGRNWLTLEEVQEKVVVAEQKGWEDCLRHVKETGAKFAANRAKVNGTN